MTLACRFNNHRLPNITMCVLFGLIAIFGVLVRPAFAQTNVPKYEKFEASFTIAGQSGNPFDPAVNDVEVTFDGPDQKADVVPAFWDGDRWRVRYAPTELGHYRLTISYNNSVIRPTDLSYSSFECVKSQDNGFIRCDPDDVQRFQFDSKVGYYPVGMDAAWRNTGGPDYPNVLTDMGRVHMNWVRIWMNNWDGKNLEWAADSHDNPPVGQYLMSAARLWDTIMDQAAANGVYVQMTVQHHGQYTAITDPNWNENPFNVRNGGFLKHPDDFFTDPEAIRLTKNKLRYIVARWGYSTHLMSFELFNEVQNIGEAHSHFQDVVNWHKTMAAYIRSIDRDHHLITTSISEPGQPLGEIGLDYDQLHTYPPDLVSVFSSFSIKGITVPIFFGECGYPGDPPEQEGRRLFHNGMWAGAMMPTAGASEFWYWDKVEAMNLWPEYGSLNDFLSRFSVSQWRGIQKVSAAVDTGSSRGDLSFAPTDGWVATTNFNVDVPSDGSVPNITGISSFIQGQGHREWTSQPIIFHVNCASPCQFQVTASTISASGAHLTLSLDGVQKADRIFPAGSGDQSSSPPVSIDVPAGRHDIALFNTGPDWFIAKQITITNLVPSVAVLAKGNATHVAFWAYNRGTESGAANARVSFAGLKPGKYRFVVWDIDKGTPIASDNTNVKAGQPLTATVKSFTADVAGAVIPYNNTER